VLGVWNAEVMRLNGILRSVAKAFLGGQVLGSASWAEAIRYLELAVAVEPNRLVHHLDLARIFRDAGRPNEARAAYQAALRAPLQDANDDRYRQSADDELKKLR
jgi:Tfp pilus assembly protein PilF